MSGIKALLDKTFGISAAQSTIGRELLAGLTTFLTMAYILFVNPDILSQAIAIDMAFPKLMFATATAAAIGCFVMGLWAKYPFALAPGMGLNAFFAFTIVITEKVPWQTALAAVFVAGVLFLVLSVTGVRTKIIDSIPLSLKRAMAAGIGFFLAVIGLKNAGLVVDHPATLVTLGQVNSLGPALTLVGILLIGVMLTRKIKGAIFYGIIAVTIAAIVTGAPVFQGKSFAGFESGLIQMPVWPTELFLAADFTGLFHSKMVTIVFALLFVDFFDTAGTLLGLAEKAGFTDKDGTLPRSNAAFGADAIATSIGALFGTSPTTTYIESASGIEQGARTGLTAVTVGVLFLLSLFLWPLASVVPAVATAPALIVVGAMMMSSMRNIDWADHLESIPAFLTVVIMPLTFSISNGIAAGIIAYSVIAMLTGQRTRCSNTMFVLSVMLVIFFVVGGH